ncbi:MULTISPECIES: hypothetical protein [Stenotrophomonas]|uniref:hypothetical protein n=1 Tax=Stenotrophomonas TaxID=40323 RepID=UPI000B6E13B7|nr:MULTISPECIES: hypothetical protein [Stenotrophomonas]SMR69274.1 hypothetical protein SAMN04487863_0265 [Stenotrophomonas sp. yr243]SNT57992.1 hypothetical protein SAMN05518671_3648 [Stenotrophomonas lactitubi]
MATPDHVHTRDDGRGRRKVVVNGMVVEQVFYADTRKGIVRFYEKPLRIHKHGKRAISRTLRGKVEVEFPDG